MNSDALKIKQRLMVIEHPKETITYTDFSELYRVIPNEVMANTKLYYSIVDLLNANGGHYKYCSADKKEEIGYQGHIGRLNFRLDPRCFDDNMNNKMLEILNEHKKVLETLQLYNNLESKLSKFLENFPPEKAKEYREVFLKYNNTSDLDEEYYIHAVSLNGRFLKYIPKEKQTHKIISAAVTQEPEALEFAADQTEDICLIAMQNIDDIYGESTPLRFCKYQNKEIILAAVESVGCNLKYAQFQDEDICIAAVKSDGCEIEDVKIQTQKIINALVFECRCNAGGSYIYKHIKPEFITNDICIEMYNEMGDRAFDYFTEKNKEYFRNLQ